MINNPHCSIKVEASHSIIPIINSHDGRGLTFLSKKSFNPANWSNQRRVWEAQQNSETEKRRIVEREAQIKREQEEEELARVVGGEEEGGRKALGFMYDGGKIPGLKKEVDGNNEDDDNNEHE
ncbi:hypothetical protein QTG54_001937 [Skeletonema marinoi]|uniref:CBF1-interacting co-repressor CIR N-terminal domain-containing protein n=1 Tax=Skeletonema marinoi TaxID=267567 RepID=A0AAD9DJ20_9STRA|nr:hypothetical protein QTG54_001937 [Skeletonema marinoi]